MAVTSAVIEDYLKAIYQHTEWQPEQITPSGLAAGLKLVPSSVTEMVQKLAAAGLVTHRRYGPISLTEAGRRKAATVVRRHRLIETWLVREYGYSWDEVHDEAEILEHAVSEGFLERIDQRLGHPKFDPHGDAIPDRDGKTEPVAFVLLCQAATGHSGQVLRISDRDPELLRELERLGVLVGERVTVAQGEPDVLLRLAGRDVQIPAAATAMIWLTA